MAEQAIPNMQQRHTRQNIEQERGRYAWECIEKVSKLSDKEQKEYRSLARGLNAMIQTNGLGQTLGFLKAKGKAGNFYYLLLEHLTGWMCNPDHFHASNSAVMNGKYDGLLRWVTDGATGNADYRRAMVECLAFGNWLRRFAEAELKDPNS